MPLKFGLLGSGVEAAKLWWRLKTTRHEREASEVNRERLIIVVSLTDTFGAGWLDGEIADPH